MTPLLPILIPLAGAAIRPWRFLPHRGVPLLRWLYALIIALTGLALGLVWLLGPTSWQLPAVEPYLNGAPTLVWSPLGFWAGGLLIFILLAGQLPRVGRPMAAEHACSRLVMLAASMGVFSAGNYVALAMAWNAPLLVLLLLRALWPDGEAERPTPREVWNALFSGGLLVLGSVALIAGQGGSMALGQAQRGLGLSAMTAAVALRVFGWPGAGGLRRRWELYLMALVTGLFLWLRIGMALQGAGPSASPGVAMGAVLVLTILGLLGALHQRPGRALPYVLAHWLVLALLAPLLDPTTGLVASLLIALLLALALLVLRIYQTSSLSAMRLGRIPYLVAWASLGGAPLTIGFVAHWLVVRSAWEAGAAHLGVWLLVGYVLNAFPAWVQGRAWMLDTPAEEAEHSPAYAVLAASGMAALPLMALGVAPPLASALWPQGPAELGILAYGRLFAGVPVSAFWPWAVALAPLLTGLAVQLGVARVPMPHLRPFYRSRRLVNADWLYAVAREQVEQVLSLLSSGLRALEGPLALAWVLLWGIALVYYMVSG